MPKGYSNEHFTVDGTLIEAWAGHKSFKRKGEDQQTPPDDPGNPSVNFHGERRTNATHQSTTDLEARLARKGLGKEARLSYAGHVQMDNRHGLVVNTRLTQASGSAEPTAALAMAVEIGGQRRVTLGADKGLRPKGISTRIATRATPRCRVLRKPPMVFIQPKISSTRLRLTDGASRMASGATVDGAVNFARDVRAPRARR